MCSNCLFFWHRLTTSWRVLWHWPTGPQSSLLCTTVNMESKIMLVLSLKVKVSTYLVPPSQSMNITQVTYIGEHVIQSLGHIMGWINDCNRLIWHSDEHIRLPTCLCTPVCCLKVQTVCFDWDGRWIRANGHVNHWYIEVKAISQKNMLSWRRSKLACVPTFFFSQFWKCQLSLNSGHCHCFCWAGEDWV